MKILVISQYWSPENGVPQRRWAWLTEMLVSAGHHVEVVAPPPHYQRRIGLDVWLKSLVAKERRIVETGASGESIVRTGYLPAGKSLTARVANQAYVALSGLSVIAFRKSSLREFRPDVIIGTVPALPTAVVTLFASHRLKAPYIIDLRDAWPELLERSKQWNRAIGNRSMRERILSFGPLQVTTKLTRIAINKSLERASGIVVTSSYLREHMREERQRRLVKHQVPEMAVVRNVFPSQTQYSHVSNHSERNEPTLNVLYAGTLGRAQDLKNALAAVEIANRQGADVRLRLVGAGATKQELRRLAKAKNLPVSVEDRQPADGLASLYRWADTALVHLSNWDPLQRAVPSKTYELMECGIHISGAVAGETAELIQRLNAGHVVTPNDPKALAGLWTELSRDRQLLEVSTQGANWVQGERAKTKKVFVSLLERVASNG